MAGGEVVNPVLGGLVENPFGGLSGDIRVEARGHRLVELALGAAGDDAHRGHRAASSRKDLGLAFARLGHGGEELLRLDRLGEDPADSHRRAVVLAEGLQLFETEAASELGCVTQLQVAVQGQVVGDERDLVFEQEPYPLSEGAHEAGRLGSVPEDPVVDDHRIRLAIGRPDEEVS